MALHSFLRASLRVIRQNFAGISISFVGLSVAFGIAILAGFYAYDSVRSDSWLPGVGRLYRLNSEMMLNGRPSMFGRWPMVQGLVGPMLQSRVPEVESVVRLMPEDVNASVSGSEYSVRVTFADATFPQLIPLAVIDGDLEQVFSDSRSIAITLRQARRLFGDRAIGQTIDLSMQDRVYSYKVAAVVQDIPPNSHFDISLIVQWDDSLIRQLRPTLDQMESTYTYVKLKEGSFSKQFSERLSKVISPQLPPGFMPGSSHDIGIEPVLGAQYFSKARGALKPRAEKMAIHILLIVAAILLLVASFNSSVVFAAIHMTRSREIAVRRIYGAGRKQLVANFVFECVLFTIAAYGMGALLASDIEPIASQLTQAPLTVLAPVRLPLFLVGLLFSIFLGVAGAVFISAKISRMKPRELLQNAQQNVVSVKDRGRQLLVALQALAVVAASIAAAQIAYQIHQYVTKDRGFRTDAVLIVTAPSPKFRVQFLNGFRNQITTLPEVERVTASGQAPFATNGDIMTSLRTPAMPETVPVWMRPVGPEYFESLGIRVVAGAGENWREQHHLVVLTYASLRAFSFATAEEAIGKTLLNANENSEVGAEVYRIAGVVEDVKDSSGTVTEPAVYFLDENVVEDVNEMMIFTAAESQQVLTRLENVWNAHFPEEKFRAQWLVDRIEFSQKDNVNLSKAAVLVALICVVLCFSGLYGMARHWLETRKRELALRRVLGASSLDLTIMFVRKMLTPISIGGMGALIPTWLLMQEWLSSLTDQSPLPLPVYALVFALTMIFATLVLIGQLWRIVHLHPAQTLYHE